MAKPTRYSFEKLDNKLKAFSQRLESMSNSKQLDRKLQLFSQKLRRIELDSATREAKYKVIQPFSCYADRNKEEEVFFTTVDMISSKEMPQDFINRLLKDGVIKKA